MKGQHAVFSRESVKWETPRLMYNALDAEFGFTLDPCPIDYVSTDVSGLDRSWQGERVFCNPPYGRGLDRWLAKGREALLAVYLLPARTDTAWFHDHALHADEIRFLRGRLTFEHTRSRKASAPFPSCLVIYQQSAGPASGEPK